jgi:hypothetical protein
MSLIQQLQNFNLDLAKLHELSNSDIIRIEKRLKAEVVLNDKWDMNDLERVIQVLKNHHQEMVWLMSDELKLLRNILTNPDRFLVKKTGVSIKIEIDQEKFALFLAKYFSEELNHYVEKCIKKGFYNALHSFLKFQDFLSPKFLGAIQIKLANKLHYAIECVKVSATDLERKVSFCSNPYFFRVLSQLGAGPFEEAVSDLLNIIINRLQTTNIHWAIVFAMGSFRAQSESVKKTLASNQKIAYQLGFRETKANEYSGLACGGVSKTGKAKSNFGQRDKEKRSRNIGFGILLIIFIVFGAEECRNRNDDGPFGFDQDRWGFDEESNRSEQLQNRLDAYDSYYNLSEADRKQLSDEANAFRETIRNLHSGDFEIISKENIPFETDLSQLNKGEYPQEDVENTKIINRTGGRIVIQARTAGWTRYDLIEPGKSVQITNEIMGIKVYIGDDPVIAHYIDKKGEEHAHFMFDSVTQEQLFQFESYISIGDLLYPNVQYEISIETVGDEIIGIRTENN